MTLSSPPAVCNSWATIFSITQLNTKEEIMIAKHPIRRDRVRHVPRQFSWVDHRLVRDRHIESLTHPAAALYLFLLTVADYHGLSFYSDPAIMARLSMAAPTLGEARRNLIETGLIAFHAPLYQVLSLDPHVNFPSSSRVAMDQPLHIGQILKKIMGETS